MTFLPRHTIAACGFACALALSLPGCDAPPANPNASEPRASASRLPDGRGSEAAAEEPDPILLPPGIDRAALDAGTVALFDGQTLFGWRGGDRVAEVRDGVLIVGNPDAADGEDRSDRDLLWWGVPLIDGRVETQLGTGHRRQVWSKSLFQPSDDRVSKPAPTAVPLQPVSTPALELTGNSHIHFPNWPPVPSTFGCGPDGLEVLEVTYTPPHRLDRDVFAEERRPPANYLDNVGVTFTPVPGNAAKVTRENDALRLTGGPGFLRSEKAYGDFVLQCEVNLHGEDSNSGLFFRTVEPTEAALSNGYEVQLQNTLGPGGRTDPDDYGDGFGTGAIFRRQPARYVNADDGAWFHLTLICVGNRMATWVNGLQVTDFTDDREPDENPREGRRDGAGYLLLQAHDAATDVSFRNFRIQRLNAE